VNSTVYPNVPACKRRGSTLAMAALIATLTESGVALDREKDVVNAVIASKTCGERCIEK
jgi:hypothetical protein